MEIKIFNSEVAKKLNEAALRIGSSDTIIFQTGDDSGELVNKLFDSQGLARSLSNLAVSSELIYNRYGIGAILTLDSNFLVPGSSESTPHYSSMVANEIYQYAMAIEASVFQYKGGVINSSALSKLMEYATEMRLMAQEVQDKYVEYGYNNQLDRLSNAKNCTVDSQEEETYAASI